VAAERRLAIVPSEGLFEAYQIEVGHIADQTIWPAVGAQAALLAGHELQRSVGAKVQQRMGSEVFTQPAVEG